MLNLNCTEALESRKTIIPQSQYAHKKHPANKYHIVSDELFALINTSYDPRPIMLQGVCNYASDAYDMAIGGRQTDLIDLVHQKIKINASFDINLFKESGILEQRKGGDNAVSLAFKHGDRFIINSMVTELRSHELLDRAMKVANKAFLSPFSALVQRPDAEEALNNVLLSSSCKGSFITITAYDKGSYILNEFTKYWYLDQCVSRQFYDLFVTLDHRNQTLLHIIADIENPSLKLNLIRIAAQFLKNDLLSDSWKSFNLTMTEAKDEFNNTISDLLGGKVVNVIGDIIQKRFVMQEKEMLFRDDVWKLLSVSAVFWGLLSLQCIYHGSFFTKEANTMHSLFALSAVSAYWFHETSPKLLSIKALEALPLPEMEDFVEQRESSICIPSPLVGEGE